MSSVPALSYNFVEIDLEIFSTVFLLLPLIQEGLCQLQVKECARNLSLPWESIDMLFDNLDMTIAVDYAVQPHTEPKKNTKIFFYNSQISTF